MTRLAHLRRAALPALFLAVALAAAGCVRSKAVITSDPPGADVHMNDIHVGRTPVEVPFTWYWYYDFKAEKEGYEATVQRERFRAPVYLWFPLDFVMELVPARITDTKRVHIEMEQERDKPEPELVQL